MRYPVIVILMSGLLLSVARAQTEDELPPDPVDGFVAEEETLPDSINGFVAEEETLPDFVDGFTTEDEVLLPDEDESSEPVNEYSYYEDTSDLIPDNPAAVLEALFEALKTGDGESVSYLVSSEALENIDIMLDVLKESIDRDEELTMNRLVAAGYTATASEIEDWSAQEYLEFTISLPIIVARYSMYEMQIGEYSLSGNSLDIPLTFVSSAGLELPFEVKLVREDNTWKVSNFMGFNSFP